MKLIQIISKQLKFSHLIVFGLMILAVNGFVFVKGFINKRSYLAQLVSVPGGDLNTIQSITWKEMLIIAFLLVMILIISLGVRRFLDRKMGID